VFLSQKAFHKLEDYLRSTDSEEQKRNRMRDAEAEAGLDGRAGSDMFAPYPSPGVQDSNPASPNLGAYADPFGQSSQQLPLVANASPFTRGGMYDDYDEGKSFRSDDIDGKSRLTSHRDDSVSNFTESYAPSRNMFQNADKNPLGKEALPGDTLVLEGETTEDIKETSTRRRWVAFVWFLTWWVPNPFLRWFGRMKRLDVRQAWREKLAINIIIWFICGCTAFVIAVLGNLICPTEHVFSISELNSHSFANNANNVYTAIRGEVFDLTNLVALHQRTVSVVSSKSILQYGGTKADAIFPVQVCLVVLIVCVERAKCFDRSAHYAMVLMGK
jgi:chitin synthase